MRFIAGAPFLGPGLMPKILKRKSFCAIPTAVHSGGQCRSMALYLRRARSLMFLYCPGAGPKTRFIIADEISIMLDVITQAQVWELLLRELKKRHIGLLAITHSEALAKRITSKIIEFNDLV